MKCLYFECTPRIDTWKDLSLSRVLFLRTHLFFGRKLQDHILTIQFVRLFARLKLNPDKFISLRLI